MSRLRFSTSPTIWASVLLCRLVLATEGPAAAVAELQRRALARQARKRKQLFRITAIVASELAKANYFPAALKHFELAIGLDSSAQSVLQSALASLKSSAAVSPWLKESYALEDVPGGLEGPLREQYEQAMGWGRDGLWDSAAAAFELLSADRAAGHAADHNLGLCRLWLGDHAQPLRPSGAGSLARARPRGPSIWKSSAS